MKYPVLISVKDKRIKFIKKTPFNVGSHPSCDMYVENKALNGFHFCVDFRNDSFFVSDGMPRNLTSVGDDFVLGTSDIELNDSAIIRAGNELFVFVDSDGDFDPEIKSKEERAEMIKAKFHSVTRGRVIEIPEKVKASRADECFISYMKNECVDDVVFFAYEMPTQSVENKRIALCVSTEEYKGVVKHLREVVGKTDKTSNVKLAAIKMADSCELEVLDSKGNEIANEYFCWNGQLFLKGVVVPASESSFSVNLKRFGKIEDTIKIEL